MSVLMRVMASAAVVTGLLLVASPAMAGGPNVSTTTTLAASKSTITTAETVTLTTTLAKSVSTICGGTMDIEQQAVPPSNICSYGLSDGVGTAIGSCTVSGSTLGVGTHSLRAKYNGSSMTCWASNSTDLTLTVVGPAAVPTTSEWTLWGLVAVFLVGGGVLISRRFKVA